MGFAAECRVDDYSELKDLRIRLGGREGVGLKSGFSLCFWIYLSSSARPSSLILRQMYSDREGEAPFLSLSEENKMTLFPLMVLHKEAPSLQSSFPWTDLLRLTAEIECPTEKWVHVGCVVARKYARLHIDGKMVREKPLTLLSENDHVEDDLKRISLVGNDGSDRKLQGYVYDVQVLSLSSSIMDHFVKNPPIKLSFYGSCLSDGVEEADDGVWSVVGGKASCRRNFSLELGLLDAFGQSVHKEMEIVASLIYADNGEPVEKPGDDSEAPLLTSSDGLELPSTKRPVMLIDGRATFKLKISQLSSKSDNRLFRVCFHTTHIQRYPFLEVFSQPICCVSRNRKWNSGFGKRLAGTQPDGTDSPADDGFPTDNCEHDHVQRLKQSESKGIPLSKRVKVGNDKFPTMFIANGISEEANKELDTRSEVKIQNDEELDSVSTDSESTDVGNLETLWTEQKTNSVQDTIVFKYCLEGTHERSILLREIISSASHQEMVNFAEQVCMYAGCSHHRYQIMISKQLMEQGSETWNLISQNKPCILWTDAASEINRKFMKIAHSYSRGLSVEDLEILRRISGCGDLLNRDGFDKLWHWLYPVAFALSKDQLNALWRCTAPKWIEGLITREEAEVSLRGSVGLQEPGTFLLRFPTSRSWPHPDSGSLVVTYVGAESGIHHKLLSLDYSSDVNEETNPRLLLDLLLEEPELSQLGSVVR